MNVNDNGRIQMTWSRIESPALDKRYRSPTFPTIASSIEDA